MSSLICENNKKLNPFHTLMDLDALLHNLFFYMVTNRTSKIISKGKYSKEIFHIEMDVNTDTLMIKDHNFDLITLTSKKQYKSKIMKLLFGGFTLWTKTIVIPELGRLNIDKYYEDIKLLLRNQPDEML